MNNPLRIFFPVLLCLAAVGQAAKIDDEIAAMRSEIAVLAQVKEQKLDQLEAAETQRWNQRYSNAEEQNLLQGRLRQYENAYASVAGDLNRKQEDILLLKNALQDEEKKLGEMETLLESFSALLSQAVNEAAARIDTDFPWDITERTARYSVMREQLSKSAPPLEKVLSKLLRDGYGRINLSAERKLSTRAALFGDGIERTVWNLRLGTILMADIDKNSEALQSLLRTGAISGARYSYRTGLQEGYYKQVLGAISAIQNKTTASVPIDILQNGKIGTEEKISPVGNRELFLAWFKKGGLTMYPLFGVAFLALILALERFITLTFRHHRYMVSYTRLIPLINAGDWEKVSGYCSAGCSGLTRAILEIIKNRGQSRVETEQQVKQILLVEIPSLEKRMSLISALGSTAPLLGLLGTVSGMITLFKVITETGANDARILAGGISEALITTQTGLVIAIPVLLMHGYLTERLDDILSHYNETVLEVFNIIFNKKRP
jgi:biopolymer transport protein ExbB/TolQ